MDIFSQNSLNPMSVNDKKLNEIRGEKRKWYGSIKSITVTPIILLVLIVIVHNSVQQFGSLKNSNITMESVDSHNIDIKEQFSMMGLSYIKWKPLINKIRAN